MNTFHPLAGLVMQPGKDGQTTALEQFQRATQAPAAQSAPVAEHFGGITQINPAMSVDTNYTVEEASRWLTCAQPVDTKLLAQLGKDCSMYCRIHAIDWTIRPTPTKPWPSERAYPARVIREVFGAHPAVKAYLPKVAP